MLVADIANLDPPTEDDLVNIKRSGVDAVIIGLQYPDPARYHEGTAHLWIPAVLDAGIPLVGVYAESQPVWETWQHVAKWQKHIPQGFQACEEDGVDRAYIDRSLYFFDSLGLEERGGVYTGAWWWDQQPDNVKHWFGDRDLFAADYNGHFDLAFRAFGDWTSCKYHQVIPDVLIGRVKVDLSVSTRW